MKIDYVPFLQPRISHLNGVTLLKTIVTQRVVIGVGSTLTDVSYCVFGPLNC